MLPYDESEVVAFAQDCDALLHPDSGRVGVNCARMQWDACNGMGYAASRAKHLAELQQELGHTPAPIPPGPVSPFVPAPHEWHGNMCGVRIPNLPPVPGGAADASLCLSWFYDRYDAGWRNVIRGQWMVKDYRHVLLSWPDSRSFGQSPAQFLATCQELIAEGFYPCVMLASKDIDQHSVQPILEEWDVILPWLIGVVPMFCVGWELSLWLSPTDVQTLIDALAEALDTHPSGAQTLRYVHFQEGYPSFQQPGGTVADFWNPNVGKLTGLLYQKILAQNDAQFLDSINDCLQRFGGGFNMVKGFDFVAFELSAMGQFNGQTSEAEGNRIGRLAIHAPAVNGVGVSGSGNGH